MKWGGRDEQRQKLRLKGRAFLVRLGMPLEYQFSPLVLEKGADN